MEPLQQNFTIQKASPEHPIAPRDANAALQMVNLDGFYNHALADNIHHKPGNSLSDLPVGISTFQGVTFDVRGLVQLAGLNSTAITTISYPKQVKGIPVNVKGKVIHVLHASAWNIAATEMEIGYYALHYAQHKTVKIPVIYRQNIWDWWAETSTEPLVAWKGQNERTAERNMHIRLFKFDIPNPFPNDEILSIDLVSNTKGPGAFVVAISIT